MRRIPRATWILVALAAVLGLVGITMTHMLARDILLMLSIGALVLAFLMLVKPSRERRYPKTETTPDATDG